MSQEFILPKRTIHLDSHTSPDIPEIGGEFDANDFARTFKEAHVVSVTLFATCHHGLAYWDTNRPERHPNLKPGLDLLGEQVDALHRVGIRTPIYLSVQCNEFCAREHPEWIAVDIKGKLVRTNPTAGRFDQPWFNWHVMDMSSPYRDYLAEQLGEVLEKFKPVDGIFMDMCWDQVSSSKWAIDGMRKLRLDPTDATARDRYARHVAHQYMGRYKKMIDDAHKTSAPVGIWFNSRPKTNLSKEKKFLRHIEIESLPTGGWGYTYYYSAK